MRVMFLAAAAALVATTAAAQDQSNRESVVVTANRTVEIARAFAGAASIPPARRDQLARWNQKICAGVAGLGGEQAQFLVDRISQRAFEVGLRPGGSGCRANILVVFTPDPNGFAQATLEQQRHFLGDLRQGLEETTTRGPEAMEEFLNSTQPVRWWHVSQTTTTDGERVREPPTCPPMAGPLCQPPQISIHGTRTLASTREDFRNVLIIVDSRHVGDLSVGAISDYIAMASLAQLDPAANLGGYDTILNLFAPNAAHSSGMTSWDLAYLQGLYHAQRNPFHVRAQERQIAIRMGRELDPGHN